MQMKDASKLQNVWGDKLCRHPRIEKEYHLGSATGEYACTTCGMTKEGSSWNMPLEVLSLTDKLEKP
jgi:hypothetical protein